MEAKEPPSTGTNAPHPLFLFSRFVRLFIFFRFIYFFYTTGSKLAKRAGSKKTISPAFSR